MPLSIDVVFSTSNADRILPSFIHSTSISLILLNVILEADVMAIVHYIVA